MLCEPKSRKISRKHAETAKNTAEVEASLCSRLLSAFAKYAPVTLTIGSIMVRTSDMDVPEPNALLKKVGTHCVTLSLSVP